MNTPTLPPDKLVHRLYWKLPPHWRRRGAFADTWRFIMKSQRWSYDRMMEWQETKLVEGVRHAARHAPFWRERFAELGMAPEDFRSRADLARLPFIGRDELRDHAEDMLPEDVDRKPLKYAATGGSSGMPVGFYRHETRTAAMEYAFVTRFRSWAGLTDTSREVICAGGVGAEDRRLWALDPRRNNLAISSDDLTRENFKWMLPLIREYQPELFRGYPSATAAFAKLLLEAGERLPVKYVLTSSETLYDAQRKQIEEAFGTVVLDLYGHSERVICAAQCPSQEGYHVFSEYGVLELIDEQGNAVTEEGAVGEVVGTTLLHDYFPLIRYRTGDRARFTAHRCSCGLPFPLIAAPDGRLQELLVADGGRTISMTSINRHDDLFAAVDQFQFHQKVAGVATLRIVAGPEFSMAEGERIARAIEGHCGEGVAIAVERVESIEKTRIGKHRFLIQEIPESAG